MQRRRREGRGHDPEVSQDRGLVIGDRVVRLVGRVIVRLEPSSDPCAREALRVVCVVRAVPVRVVGTVSLVRVAVPVRVVGTVSLGRVAVPVPTVSMALVGRGPVGVAVAGVRIEGQVSWEPQTLERHREG